MSLNERKTIAICGKGGVGKTFLTSAMTSLLTRQTDGKILAVDADPAFGLAPTLDIAPDKTIDDIRNELIDKVKNGAKNTQAEIIEQLDYEVFDALEEKQNFGLLAIGRPEDGGCYCQVNEFLKEVIKSLSKNFDVVLIDGEAGIEQIHRRVMKNIDDLIVVSDTSAKGINVANTIREVAEEEQTVGYGKISLILNKIQEKGEVKQIVKNSELELLGWIPEDEKVRKFDMENTPITQIPDSSPSMKAVQEILVKLVS